MKTFVFFQYLDVHQCFSCIDWHVHYCCTITQLMYLFYHADFMLLSMKLDVTGLFAYADLWISSSIEVYELSYL